MRACKACGVRWAQSAAGLCRRCSRAAGDTSSTFDRDRARAERQQAAELRVEYRPMEPKPIQVDGREYFVIWDGVVRAEAVRHE